MNINIVVVGVAMSGLMGQRCKVTNKPIPAAYVLPVPGGIIGFARVNHSLISTPCTFWGSASEKQCFRKQCFSEAGHRRSLERNMFYWLLTFLGLGSIALAVKKRMAEPEYTPSWKGTKMEKLWGPVVATVAPFEGIPYEFVMEYMEHESGGNPCAIGRADQFGPDGKTPREIGLFQLYNPDDFKALGLSAQKMRAYCKPGTQVQTRDLTGAESLEQVQAGVALIKRLRDRAVANLRKHGVKLEGRLSPDQPDYWKFVKLGHGLPGLQSSGLAVVTKRLGRPITSWQEFEDEVNDPGFVAALAKVDKGTWAYRSAFAKVLNNARRTGGAVKPKLYLT